MFETINFPRRISNEKTWKQTGITNRPELKVMFRRLATTIFSATQHYNSVAALFLMVATLFQQCYAALRSKSSLRIVTQDAKEPLKAKVAKKRFFFLERNSKVLYLSSQSLSCFPVLIRTELSRRSRATLHRNAQKSVMHVQSYCFANQNLSLF